MYIKDVFMANLIAARANTLNGGVMIVGTGSCVRLIRLWELMFSFSGQQLAPTREPARVGDILHSVASMESTELTLYFKNDFTLEQGLELTFEWYKERN